MDSYRSTVIERSTLTFSVEGLQAREELLFKAFVRLLDHLTHQQWRYHPPTADTQVDLLVAAEGVEPTYCTRPGQQPQPVLQLGATGANGHGVLSWPLKPGDLEKELNRLGGLVITQRGPKVSAPLFTGATHDTPIESIARGVQMRLQQWPPTKHLAGPGRMRLATLLTGKAMSLDELVYRSALPLPLCEAFVNDLLRAKLLVAPPMGIKPEQQKGAATQKAVQRGLLARIRMRLGISS